MRSKMLRYPLTFLLPLFIGFRLRLLPSCPRRLGRLSGLKPSSLHLALRGCYFVYRPHGCAPSGSSVRQVKIAPPMPSLVLCNAIQIQLIELIQNPCHVAQLVLVSRATYKYTVNIFISLFAIGCVTCAQIYLMSIHPKKMFYYHTAPGAIIVASYWSPSLAKFQITYFSYLKLLKCQLKANQLVTKGLQESAQRSTQMNLPF